MGLRIQPRNERFFTLFGKAGSNVGKAGSSVGKAGSNVVESAAIRHSADGSRALASDQRSSGETRRGVPPLRWTTKINLSANHGSIDPRGRTSGNSVELRRVM
ncbi:hypothetical protein [Streptantibioticus ferralitis]|uniref:Uncharacterized protein n=1 Tax=Streptantibioticus ferralitis TaxID=236510 RepID=A0ABT5YT04_9ACTN|nr:hypothetical protein [Streptantibioticus ferralitis]MDF2254738.1 hypothetical protein [Streptantibioticus ferralitis]